MVTVQSSYKINCGLLRLSNWRFTGWEEMPEWSFKFITRQLPQSDRQSDRNKHKNPLPLYSLSHLRRPQTLTVQASLLSQHRSCICHFFKLFSRIKTEETKPVLCSQLFWCCRTLTSLKIHWKPHMCILSWGVCNLMFAKTHSNIYN